MSILRNKQDGYMTVFASLCFAIILSLVTVCIDGARLQGSKALAYMINDMSLDTLMSYYHKALFEEYQLLFLDAGFGENTVNEDKLKEIAINNAIEISEKPDGVLLSYTEFLDADLSELEITKMVKAVDAGGKIFEKEISEYVLLGLGENALEMFLGEVKEFTSSQSSSSDTKDETKSIQKKLTVQNEKVFELLQAVEGIVTKNGTIQIKSNRLSTKSSFAKKIIYYDKSMSETGINNSDIYNALQSEYVELNKVLADFKDAYSSIENPDDTKAMSQVDDALKEDISSLESTLKDVVASTNEALKLITGVESAKEDVEKQKEEVKANILKKDLDDATKELLTGSVDEMCGGNSIYDEAELKSSLEHNKNVYEQLLNMIDTISQSTTSTNLSTKIDAIINADNYAKTLKIRQMSFDYTNFDMNANNDAKGVLDSIEEFLDNGLLSLVVEDVSTLSQNTLTVTHNTLLKGETDIETPSAVEAKFYTVEYALDHFASYTSDDANNNLKYELEYLLCGEDTDKANLSETVLKIAAIREIPNLAHLLTDPVKKEEALVLATALVGFIGVYPLVVATQYLILGLWAYAEGIMDAKTLLSGGKVALTKTSETWKTSLDSLMGKSLGLDESKGSQDENGLTYNQYLRFMLYLQNQETTITRMMDLIDEKMRKKGYGQFAIKNCIYLVETVSSYDIGNGYGNISIEARKNY